MDRITNRELMDMLDKWISYDDPWLYGEEVHITYRGAEWSIWIEPSPEGQAISFNPNNIDYTTTLHTGLYNEKHHLIDDIRAMMDETIEYIKDDLWNDWIEGGQRKP